MHELMPWLLGLSFVFVLLIFIGSVRLSTLKQRIHDVRFGSERPSSSVTRIVVETLEDEQKGWRILVLLAWISLVANIVGIAFVYA